MKGRLHSLVLLIVLSGSVLAEVVRVDVHSRADLAPCEDFRPFPCYEALSGRIHYAVDPANSVNDHIVDLKHAVPNDAGLVEFSADFQLLRPKDFPAAGQTLLFEVPNRGRKGAIRQFHRNTQQASGSGASGELGDAFLFRHGFSLLWVGWQFDTPVEEGKLRAYLPVATDQGRKIRGLVRSDFYVAEKTYSHSLGDRGHVAYPVADPQDARNVLTVRESAYAERKALPRNSWSFARLESGRVVPDPRSVHLASGFEPNHVYEVVYVSEEPPVAGLGLAAIRDAVAYLKFDVSAADPLGVPPGSYDRAIAYGASQSGRLLRTFVYDGFNEDESHRKVFDGILAHIAGGQRGGFNIRFAQASRSNEECFYYPTGTFPFADSIEPDAIIGLKDGLLANVRTEFVPKIFYTNSSTEYWISAAALSHTSVDGARDLKPVESTRIYHFAGTQHGPSPLPEHASMHQPARNPNDYGWFLRSLILKLDAWVRHGTPPPDSRYPKVQDSTLVPVAQVGFPDLSSISVPDATPVIHRLDFGPQFRSGGIADLEPPAIGEAYPRLVPQVDANGNEIGGLKTPELAVPLGTYTGWQPFDHSRKRLFVPLGYGVFVPFPLTQADRERYSDPRSSINELYADRDSYLGQVSAVALNLVEDGYVLGEDVGAILERARENWDRVIKASNSDTGE